MGIRDGDGGCNGIAQRHSLGGQCGVLGRGRQECVYRLLRRNREIQRLGAKIRHVVASSSVTRVGRQRGDKPRDGEIVPAESLLGQRTRVECARLFGSSLPESYDEVEQFVRLGEVLRGTGLAEFGGQDFGSVKVARREAQNFSE